MNAPHDGDRGGTTGNGRPAPQQDPHHEPYLGEAYTEDPYRERHPSASDPVSDALHDGASNPPVPGTNRDPEALYRAPTPPPQSPDTHRWAPTPPPEPSGPSRRLPYGDKPASEEFTGLDSLLSPSPDAQAEQPRHDAFAHLYRDQQADAPTGPTVAHAQHQPSPPPGTPRAPQARRHGPTGEQSPTDSAAAAPQPPLSPPGPLSAATVPPPPDDPPQPTAPPSGDPSPASGKVAGLLRSSAIMAAGTMVSRLTGFVRSALIVVALGTALLGDSYQLAITLPTMLYILTVGGGLNSVFVPQLVRAMKRDADGGEAYANRLLTLVSVLLGALAVASYFAAPLLVRAMSVSIAEDPAANDVATTFVRFCMPSIFFMGIHVVMGQILNARGRFGAMMWTPVLNNVVIIASVGAFLWVYGTSEDSDFTVETIPPEGVQLLGIGTLLGLVVQALAMVPFLRAAGFRIRPRFDWRGHGLGKAAKLAKWTVFFVLANQAGVLVVSQLSTWANSEESDAGAGFAAYSNAQLIWNMPQAIITVSVMAALLPRLSRAASDGDAGAVRDDISQGLRNSAVAIVPIAFGFVSLGVPMCLVIYSGARPEDAVSMGYMLMAFGVGLIPFSVQYVVLRAFYAYEDTRTPFYNTVIVAAVNAAASGLCFLLLPARWAVVGMAGVYGLAYVIGVGVAWRRLRRKLGGDLDGARIRRTYVRLIGASIPATLASGAAAYGVLQALGTGLPGALTALAAGGLVLAAVFVLAARQMRVTELTAMVGMVRARIGR